MVKITSISINGYRNIINTTLVLEEALTILLAPNNYGKTNFLHGINFAAELVGSGEAWQADLIRQNGYLSSNKANAPDSFRFSITFLANEEFIEPFILNDDNIERDSGFITVTYTFDIAPKKGVLYECLLVDERELYTRENEILDLYGTRYRYNAFNLALAITLWPDKLENVIGVYARIVRWVFMNLEGIFGDGEGQFNEKPDEREKKNISYLFTLMKHVKGKTTKDEPTSLSKYKEDFSQLFPAIHSFLIRDIRSGKEVKNAPAESDDSSVGYYKLLFETDTKKDFEMFDRLSAGTRRIFSILLAVYRRRDRPLIGIEELENGIHPLLHRDMLGLLNGACENAKIVLTSHSPTVIRHIGAKRYRSFYVGVPNEDGYATFLPLDPAKLDIIMQKAESLNTSIGELLFDMMSGSKASKKELKGWLVSDA